MKQSTTTASSSRESSLLASATQDEITVSQILLDLRNLMSLSESLANFNWGCRRRRSYLDASPPLPSASPPSVQRTDSEIEDRKPHIEVVEEKTAAAACTTASPDTPLSFSPSESDEQSKHSSKKTSKKRSREEYMDMIEGLTQRKHLLRGEIENVKKYYDKLKAYNSQLKAMKEEALNYRKKEAQKEINRGANVGIEHYRIHMVVSQPHQQPFTTASAGQDVEYSFGPTTASNNGLGFVGPLGLDLNVPAEEAFEMDLYQPLDVSRELADKRARFAEARMKRRGIMKTKSNRTVV